MDVATLRAFVAVADMGSFSRAADRLHLTQPAVSKRVANLEQELLSPLFDRLGREIRLTPAGLSLLPRARRIIDEISEGRREIANLSGAIEGRLTIGTSHHIGLHHLPKVLRAYRAKYPSVELDLQFLGSEDVVEQVLNGQLEMGIVTLPPEPLARLHVESIWSDPMVPVCAVDHPLLDQITTLHDLVEYPAILTAMETYTRQLVDRDLLHFGIDARVEFSTNYLETIKMMVGVGLGWSVLPLTMVDREVVTIVSGELTIERQLGLVLHRSRTLSNAAVELVNLLRSTQG